MSKWSNDTVLDALLDKVAESTQLLVVTAQPSDRSEALAIALAAVSIDGSDFTKSNAVSGRQTTVSQQMNIPVTSDGTATHVALVDGSNLLYVTTCPVQVLTSGNTVTVPEWRVIIADPV